MSASSEIVLGIDLGTTYSTAAAIVDGKVQYALDGNGEACLPTVVHFPKSGPPIVGFQAEKLRLSDPQNTVFGVKRLLGRPADSPSARLLDAVAGFRIKPSPGGGEASILVRAGEFSASEVAAIVLRHLKERAEFRFGKRIGKVVVTVPATAIPSVHEAMVRCGKMAGLEVIQIVPEPVAGAVARGADAAAGAPFLVYDFGGGTLDATVVRRDGKGLHVMATGGDDCLGGDDFDSAFANWISAGMWRLYSVDVTKDAVAWARIQRQCELVKRALSSAAEAKYQLKDAFSVGGQVKSLDYVFTRDHLAPHWQELVERSVLAAHDTVREAGLGPEQLSGILLIGGTTYIPQVRAAMAAAFPRPCIAEDDPQTAVARGAALVGARVTALHAAPVAG